jgi:hypothetical protein
MITYEGHSTYFANVAIHTGMKLIVVAILLEPERGQWPVPLKKYRRLIISDHYFTIKNHTSNSRPAKAETVNV